MPLRFGLREVAEINLAQVWALGVIECRLGLTILRSMVQPSSGTGKLILDGADAIWHGGTRRPQVWIGYKEIVAPIAGWTLLLLVLPALMADIAVGRLSPCASCSEAELAGKEQLLLRMAYASVLFSGL